MRRRNSKASSNKINAKFQKNLAINQLSGNLSSVIQNWNKKLLKLLSHYEGQIVFPEDEVPVSIEKKVISQVSDLIEEIDDSDIVMMKGSNSINLSKVSESEVVFIE